MDDTGHFHLAERFGIEVLRARPTSEGREVASHLGVRMAPMSCPSDAVAFAVPGSVLVLCWSFCVEAGLAGVS